MIFYHGTTLDAAKQIAKVGLIPHRETAYRLKDEDGEELRDQPGEDKPYVYLQTKEQIAVSYAKFRAKYERAANGTKITVSGLLSEMWKDTDYRNPNAKPALVVFDVPPAIADQFKMDPKDWAGGNVCLCTIAPQYVRGIWEVR